MKRPIVFVVGGETLTKDQRAWLTNELQDYADQIMIENEFLAEDELDAEAMSESEETEVYAKTIALGGKRIVH